VTVGTGVTVRRATISGASAPRRRQAAHRLLRALLAELLGCPVPDLVLERRVCPGCGGPHGRPRVRHPSTTLEFSLAHSGREALVAVADGIRVGVDLQVVSARRDLDRLARRILAPSEREQVATLAAPDQHRAVLGAWARTEACLKACGIGLEVPLADLRTGPPAAGPRPVEVLGHRMTVENLVTDRAEYVAALACGLQ